MCPPMLKILIYSHLHLNIFSFRLNARPFVFIYTAAMHAVHIYSFVLSTSSIFSRHVCILSIYSIFAETSKNGFPTWLSHQNIWRCMLLQVRAKISTKRRETRHYLFSNVWKHIMSITVLTVRNASSANSVCFFLKWRRIFQVLDDNDVHSVLMFCWLWLSHML
jgi:hypothetical protein